MIWFSVHSNIDSDCYTIGAKLTAKISKIKGSKTLRYTTDALEEEKTLNTYKNHIKKKLKTSDREHTGLRTYKISKHLRKRQQ